MPIPPTSGVADARQRPTSGGRPRRRESGDRRRAQTTAAAAGRAARATTVLTKREGRGTVLGLCVPARSLPTLDRSRDGLHRPRPLPRAVLQPLQARLPGEVQGVAARRLLVAPEPARAARRVPARLRRHLPVEDAALRALPPLGPRLLDLLRDVAPVGGALARRLGRPPQEGALPAPARRAFDGRDAGRHVCGDGRGPDRALARSPRRRADDGV